jgi:hypothetical protein
MAHPGGRPSGLKVTLETANAAMIASRMAGESAVLPPGADVSARKTLGACCDDAARS